MLSSLKIAAAVLLLLVVFHFWPTLAGLVLVVFLTLLAFGGAVAGGLAVLLALSAAIGLALLAGLVAVGVALAPLWIPVLAVIGLIALIRSGRPRAA